jgi:hypothetical protein
LFVDDVAGCYMNLRFRYFGFHLLASLGVLLLLLGVLYIGWYAWPGWYLLGAGTIAGVLILVDVGLGPLATFVVSSPAKSRSELKRDISLIVLVQFVALGYGASSLWMGRPLYYSFSEDRIEIVPAVALDEKSVEIARQQGGRYVPEWSSRPQWIWAPLPDNDDERERIMASAVFGGLDVIAMPQYFRPFDEGKAAMRERFLPVRILLGKHGLSDNDLQELVARLGYPESELAVLPVQGRVHDGAWIFARSTATPLAFQPVVIWGEIKKPDRS